MGIAVLRIGCCFLPQCHPCFCARSSFLHRQRRFSLSLWCIVIFSLPIVVAIWLLLLNASDWFMQFRFGGQRRQGTTLVVVILTKTVRQGRQQTVSLGKRCHIWSDCGRLNLIRCGRATDLYRIVPSMVVGGWSSVYNCTICLRDIERAAIDSDEFIFHFGNGGVRFSYFKQLSIRNWPDLCSGLLSFWLRIYCAQTIFLEEELFLLSWEDWHQVLSR